MIDRLQSRRLIFVTGKGGVGKSTLAASIARALGAAGRRALVVETDAYSAIGPMLGVEPNGDEPVEAGGGVSIVNLRSDDALRQTVAGFVPSARLTRSIMNNRVARIFFGAAPSVAEFSTLFSIERYLEDDDRFDTVVVDLPATGHAITFLGVPRTLHRMLKIGKLAHVTDRIAQLISDPERCAIVAACIPEEMPVNETLELDDALRAALGRGLSAVGLNMIHAAPVDEGDRASFERALAAPPEGWAPIARANQLAEAWYVRDRRHAALLRDGLAAEVAIAPIPMAYAIEPRAISEVVGAALLGGGAS